MERRISKANEEGGWGSFGVASLRAMVAATALRVVLAAAHFGSNRVLPAGFTRPWPSSPKAVPHDTGCELLSDWLATEQALGRAFSLVSGSSLE